MGEVIVITSGKGGVGKDNYNSKYRCRLISSSARRLS